MKIWVLYGSLDWNEFSEVHLTEESANASMQKLFNIPEGAEEDDVTDLFTEAYENGDWKAFSIDEHEIEIPGIRGLLEFTKAQAANEMGDDHEDWIDLHTKVVNTLEKLL